MKHRDLAKPEGYNFTTQNTVALFAAQLDDQLRRLKESIKDLSTEHFEWQPHKGVNTIGMLLAHLAIVEVFWINISADEMTMEPDGENYLKMTIGITSDDDGLPLKPEGVHPDTLKGKSLEDYYKMLDGARAAVHIALRKWSDKDLDLAFKRRDWTVSRRWTIYHVLEHFASHYGQILLLMHLMRDAGVLKGEAEK